jgi:hypothetical protein
MDTVRGVFDEQKIQRFCGADDFTGELALIVTCTYPFGFDDRPAPHGWRS